MAGPNPFSPSQTASHESIRLTKFCIEGLFNTMRHEVVFPDPPQSASEPSLLILEGPNGSGKTTILKMIRGMLALNFDEFRRVPFSSASLSFSNGDKLVVTRRTDEKFPLNVEFRGKSAVLPRNRQHNDHPKIREAIALFRADASTVVGSVRFELIDIHRSFALRGPEVNEEVRFDVSGNVVTRVRKSVDEIETLAKRVLGFINEAQVNYRKFFSAEDLELLPRILERLHATKERPTSRDVLADRVARIKERFPLMKRYGLQTDDADLETLRNVILSDDRFGDPSSYAVIEAYVEMQENKSRSRDLIATRLLEFEKIMDDFLVGKKVRVDGDKGLVITAGENELQETELSSGEYHFLFMMVAALLCYRTGSIIAIDEPELSLHVSWQRKVVSALARCASGASPLFLFATHSSAIGAQHMDRVKELKVREDRQ